MILFSSCQSRKKYLLKCFTNTRHRVLVLGTGGRENTLLDPASWNLGNFSGNRRNNKPSCTCYFEQWTMVRTNTISNSVRYGECQLQDAFPTEAAKPVMSQAWEKGASLGTTSPHLSAAWLPEARGNTRILTVYCLRQESRQPSVSLIQILKQKISGHPAD